MNVNAHERLSSITLRHNLKSIETVFLLQFYMYTLLSNRLI